MKYGDVLGSVHCERTRAVLRAALDAGWEWVGLTKSGHVEIRWPETDARLHCGTTPSGNSWKAFARDVERVSGVVVWRKGNRRRSRKSTAAEDEAVRAARRKHREAYEERLARQQLDREAARQGQAARTLAAQQAALSQQREREIQDLMRPGRGR